VSYAKEKIKASHTSLFKKYQEDLNKPSMREFIIGVRLHLSCFNIPDDFSWNLIGFDNLLQFLKVDKSTRNFLIKKTHHQKIFEELKKFFN